MNESGTSNSRFLTSLTVDIRKYCFLLFLSAHLLSVPSLTFAQQLGLPENGDSTSSETEIVSLEGQEDELGTEEEVVFYQVNVDSLNRSDSIPIFSDAIIEKRLKSIEKTIPLRFNSTSKSFIDYFTVRNRGYSTLMAQRMEYYFPLFEEALKRHGMPEELKYLAVVESGLQPKAISRVGAAGLWQFMPATGRAFKLYQDVYVDERLQPNKATEAACAYLKELYQIFGNWELAIASYNCGPGNIRKAIRRSGGKKDFWLIYRYLPRETRSYLPQFIALAYTLNFAGEHLLLPDYFDRHMEVDTIFVSQYVNLQSLASFSGICFEDLIKLNPELRLGVVSPEARSYPLRVPSDKSDFIRINFESLMDSSSAIGIKDYSLLLAKASAGNYPGSIAHKNKVYHTVRSGDMLGRIASKYGVSVSSIKSWNQLNSNTVRIGQRLVIYTNKKPTHSPSAKSNPIAKSKPLVSPVSDGVSKFHFVQPGDTLWDISRKYEVSIEKLKKLNNLNSSQIKVGMKLKIG